MLTKSKSSQNNLFVIENYMRTCNENLIHLQLKIKLNFVFKSIIIKYYHISLFLNHYDSFFYIKKKIYSTFMKMLISIFYDIHIKII